MGVTHHRPSSGKLYLIEALHTSAYYSRLLDVAYIVSIIVHATYFCMMCHPKHRVFRRHPKCMRSTVEYLVQAVLKCT